MSTSPGRRFKNAIYEQFARVSKAMASAHRVELVELLSQGPRTVEALARLVMARRIGQMPVGLGGAVRVGFDQAAYGLQRGLAPGGYCPSPLKINHSKAL